MLLISNLPIKLKNIEKNNKKGQYFKDKHLQISFVLWNF